MSFNITIDANRRIDFLLQDSSLVSPDTLKRISDLALPLLSMNDTTRTLVSVGMGGYRSWALWTDTYAHYQSGNWTECAKTGALFVLVVSGVALAILIPPAERLLSCATELATQAHTLVLHLLEQEWNESLMSALGIAHQLIYVASIVVATSEWLALSLLLQAFVELKRAYEEYAENGIDSAPEILLHLFLAAIRIRGAAVHLKKVHRDWFGKELTQKEWENLYKQIQDRAYPQSLVDFENELSERGISSYIKKVDFRETAHLCHIYFHNLHFVQCNFSGVDFEGSCFHLVTANSCLFHHSSWIGVVAQDSLFNNCGFSFASLVQMQANRLTFSECDLTALSFNESELQRLTIDRCKLKETCFLGGKVSQGRILNSDLTDCLLLDTESAFVMQGCSAPSLTKPIVGIPWHFKHKGIFNPVMYEALRNSGAIPLRFEYLPEDVDADLLEKEVQDGVFRIRTERPKEMLSIADELIKRAKSDGEIAKLKKRASLVFQFLDGLSLPGGADIHPEFYGADREEHTYPDPDYRRSILEFALLAQSHQHKLPTMGTCRGSQMINVYFGGTMKQDVPGHWGFKPMEIIDSSRKEEMQNLLGDSFIAFSAHHQAADQMGKDLEVVMKAENVVKFFISRDGNFIGSQIHPEIYMTLEKDSILPIHDDSLPLAIFEKNRKIYQMFLRKVKSSNRVVA